MMGIAGHWRLLLGLGATLLAAVVLWGCGPTQSTIRINEAEVAFEKAVLVDAENKAPYEYHNAAEYLHKAKEEWGFSDFEAAINYAGLAREFAEKATIKAKGGDIDLKDAQPDKKSVPGAPVDATDKDADELEGLE